MPKGLSYGDEIWYGNTCERVACFYGVSHASVSSGAAQAFPNFQNPPTYDETV